MLATGAVDSPIPGGPRSWPSPLAAAIGPGAAVATGAAVVDAPLVGAAAAVGLDRAIFLTPIHVRAAISAAPPVGKAAAVGAPGRDGGSGGLAHPDQTNTVRASLDHPQGGA